MKLINPASVQGKILAAVEASTEISAKELAELFQQSKQDYQRMTRALQDMVGHGHIARIGRGLYTRPKTTARLRNRKSQERMARYAHIRTIRNEPFARSDMAFVCECSDFWAKRYINALRKAGFLQKVGLRGGKVPLYLATQMAVEMQIEEWPVIRKPKAFTRKETLLLGLQDCAARIFAASRAETISLGDIAALAQELTELAVRMNGKNNDE